MTSKNTLYQVSRDDRGKFIKGSSGNPSGRPAGSSCRALKMARDAVESTALPMLITACENGSLEACRILLSYGLPRQKPISIPESIIVPETDGFSSQMKQLLNSVYCGELSSTVASEIANVIAVAAKVEEVTILQEQVASLKRVLTTRNDGKKNEY